MNTNKKAELLALSYKILEENVAQTKREDQANYTEMLRLLNLHRELEESVGQAPSLQKLTEHIEDLHQRLQHYQLTGEFLSKIAVTASNDETRH